jgi:hypothetical protein
MSQKKKKAQNNELPVRKVGGQQVPWRAGQLILTDRERRASEAIGLQDGGDIPESLRLNIENAQREIAKEMQEAIPGPADLPPLTPPPIAAMEDLPEEKQKELAEFLKWSNDLSQAPGNIQVTDSREESKEELDEESVNEVGQELLDDGLRYVQCLLGEQPFEKTYKLLGDKLTVTFRSLTMPMVSCCENQVFADRREGRIDSDISAAWTLLNYRMTLGLKTIIRNGEEVNFAAGTEAFLQKVSGTDVARLHQLYTQETMLSSETLFRLVRDSYRQFEETVDYLEEAVKNPDFLEAIESCL